ncbi:hypothetical protein RJ639_014022 [Escallonia herrerae]|uniref:Reverse transcriptase/retrotransposon-derived protein RNase H-like domain-containing protein n=1 Tax=Escallonia herrerae TaxID=1293975 RepID=A0AA89AMH0_9ASTE|nr:hypothetical protein RJ639_014022 [Escallonia herrerae]
MTNLFNRLEKYLQAEEDSMLSQETYSSQKRRDRPNGRILDNELKRSQAPFLGPFSPLDTSDELILNQSKGQNIVEWPKPMRMSAEKRDPQLYYHFHKDHGHTMENYLKGVIVPHDDDLVITLQINAYSVKRILVDTRSSTDISFDVAFSQMEISKDRVKPFSLPLYGFTRAFVPVEGIVPLMVIADTAPLQATQTIDFLIVKVKLSYNKILGQTLARKCYLASCKAKETLAIKDQRDEQNMKLTELVKELITIVLEGGDKERQLRIGSTIKPTLRSLLISFLWYNVSVFACIEANPEMIKAIQDMEGLRSMKEVQAFFKALKDYLSSTPVLSKPIMGEELLLYLVVAEAAVNVVLIQGQDNKQLPIYYLRKMLQGVELHYPSTKKLAFTLLIVVQKLRPYF